MSNINYKEVGQRIKKKRKGKITQEKLAEILGLNKKTIINWEKGELDKKIDFDKFLEMCAVLEMDIPFLLGNDYSTKELETVCKYTGLSENTAKLLHRASKFTGATQNVPAFLSDLFDNYDALIFLDALEEYMRSSYCEKVLPQKGDNATIKGLYTQYRDKAALNQIHCENLLLALKDTVEKDKYIEDRVKDDRPLIKTILSDKEQ